MSLALKIIAGALSALAITSGTALAIPKSREFILNTVAPYSEVYVQQEDKNEELENQRSQICNEITNLQNQKTILEEGVEQLQNNSTADQQTIQTYLDQIDTLNRQIELLQNIRVDFDNSSITYRGSYSSIIYSIFDDNGIVQYQSSCDGTQYDGRYCFGDSIALEIDNYLSIIELMNKSLALSSNNYLSVYSAYQIVIGPYGIMWNYPNGQYSFTSDTVMDLKFTFNKLDISADDLRNSLDNSIQYSLVIDFSYNLNNDGLVSDITCNFKVS